MNLTAPAENRLVYMSVNVYRLLFRKDPGDGTLLKRPDLLHGGVVPDKSHQRHQPAAAIIRRSNHFKRELEVPHRVGGNNCWVQTGAFLCHRNGDR